MQTEPKLLNFAYQISGGVTDVLQTLMNLLEKSHVYFYRIILVRLINIRIQYKIVFIKLVNI